MKRPILFTALLAVCCLGLAATLTAQTTTAVLTSPANGSTAADLTQSIQWTPVTGAEAYYLYLGTTVGAKDLVNSGELQATSFRATGVMGGLTVYARLWTKVAGVWRYTDSSFTTLPVARLTFPLNGAGNVDASLPLQWTTVQGAQAYYLYLGTSVGAKDLANSGEITQTSYKVASPPAGLTVYARLWTKTGGTWRYVDSTYSTTPAALVTYPAKGSADADLSHPVLWTTVPGAQAYYLYLGTSAGGKDVVNSGETTQTSFLVAAPPGGITLYARLWTKVNNVWRYTDSTFTTLAVATITAPAYGGVADLSKPIAWTAVTGAQAYYLYVGTSLGAKDLLNTGELQVTSYAWSRPPAGQTVFARLWTKVGGIWRSTDSTFRYPAGATVTSPANGATGADLSLPVTWTAASSAQTYQLYLGTTPGAKDLADSGEITTTSYAAAVWTAQTVYARLFTKINGVRLYTDSVFTTRGLAPTFTYPAPGTTRITLSQPLAWTPVPGAQAYYLYVGTTAGAKNLVNTGETQATSYKPAALPVNQTLYARIWAKVGGVWRYTDTSFTVLHLIQSTDMVYQGAFRLPAGLHAGGQANAGFEYGGTGIGYNPVHDTLFVVGHMWDQFLAEVTIPPLLGTPVTWPTATVIQPLRDPLEWQINSINPSDPNSKNIGGVLPYQNHLYITAYSYYDGLGRQWASHFVRPTDLSLTGQLQGPYTVSTMTAGFVSGYFGLVPSDWQAAFGGPVLNGNCCLNVISRTSFGPAVFAIDPATIGTTTPAPAQPLLYYTVDHPLLEPGASGTGWSNTSTLFNGTTQVTGVVFPEHTASVLFFGRQGFGAFCYGPGTSNAALAGTPTGDGVDVYCYDPTDDSKGVHAYPYSEYVWAYDATELADVKAGRRQPWDVRPYATWTLPLPWTGSSVGGATYDPSTGRLFVSQLRADGTLPLIHIFTLK